MNSTEDRLRAAAHAAASTVPPGSAPPLRLTADLGRAPARPRRPRRRGWRWVAAPLAAAAAVLAVLAASLALAHGAPGDQRVPSAARDHTGGPAPVPAYYVALMGRGNFPAGGSRQYAEVRATGSGKVLATIRPPAPYRTFEQVTAAADDRTFVLAAGPWKVSRHGGGTDVNESPLKFFVLKLSPTGRVAQLRALPIPAVPQADGIALSPDASRLAMAFSHERQHVIVDPEIQVFTLAGGAVRTWVWPGRAWITSNDADSRQLMSWTADGRTLAYEQWLGDDEQVRLLDTTAPGTDLRASKLVLDFPHQAYTTWKFTHGKIVDALDGYNALITPDGTKIIAGTDTETKHPVTSDQHFTVFSAKTGAALRELHRSVRAATSGQAQDVQWVSPSGDAFIGTVLRPRPDPSGQLVMGVMRGDHFTPLPGDFAAVTGVAW